MKKFIGACILAITSGCASMAVPPVPPPPPPPPPPLPASVPPPEAPQAPSSHLSFVPISMALPHGEREAPGFGLYSYLLFDHKPVTPAERDAAVFVVKCALAYAPIVIGDEKLNRGEYDVLYFLTDTSATLWGPDAPTRPEDWIVDHLDIRRSQSLIRRLRDAHYLRGRPPYLVTAFGPATERMGRPLLTQSLGGVPLSQRSSWIALFVEQSTAPRKWDEESLEGVVLTVNKFLSTVGETLGMSATAVGQLLHFAKTTVGQ